MRSLKEQFYRIVCWAKQSHSPAVLEDDETIYTYCERCGTVLGKLPRKRKPSRPVQRQREKPTRNISRFFDGKSKQAPWYRKTIKEKVQPEEDEE